jgi:hypothetical protein
MASIAQIIGKVNPRLYASNGSDLLKKYGSAENIPADEIKPKATTYSIKDGFFKLEEEGAEASHTLVYDSSSETLEPIYFFILDLMNDLGFKSEKLIDNFTSSPGSGHFQELATRKTIMQQQGTKLLGDVNTVLRSILNIIYDLKEFRIRLNSYDELKSGNKEAALLSLKQVWMDKVDITKGNSSLKAMGLGQAGFQTLLDAFLAAKDAKDAEKLDLNDRVKRILKARLQEFNIWLSQSESELRKRYEMEKTYLKSQVSSLKIYARWAKPYLKFAQELESKESGRSPDVVKAFNTIVLELTLLGKREIKVKDDAIAGKLPKEFQEDKFLKTLKKRNYNTCVLVQFTFRGIPQKAMQQSHFTFGGRAEVSFKAYALNDDEIKKIDEELESDDIGTALQLVESATTESLGQLKEDIDFFLEEDSQKKEEKQNSGDVNPFKALVGGYDKSTKKETKKEETKSETKKTGSVIKDDFIEKAHLRPLAAEGAQEMAFTIFDIYKKAHGMPSYT